MTKAEFENLLRRAGKIARDSNFYLIGSQSLRGVSPVIPRDFPKTLEADLYPRQHPEAWNILRTELGNQSKFFKTHGYYLDCTDPGLATFPNGWEERLIPYRTAHTGGVTAWCLEPHDLFVGKLAVWRDKDQKFLDAMLRHKLVKSKIVLSRIDELSVANSARIRMKSMAVKLVESSRLGKRKRRSG